MKHKKLLDVLAIIMLAIGFFLAFLPHAFHTRLGLSEQTSHIKHVIYGIATIIVALAILIYNNDALSNPVKRFIFKK